MKGTLTLLFYLVFVTGYSQLSKTHYIPPFHAHNENTLVPREQVLYISTPNASANYTITDGAGLILQTGTVLSGSYEQYDMDGYGTAFIVDNNELNTPKINKGLIITADSEIYANLRVSAGTGFQQGGSLTSKGIHAYGTTYRLGHIPSIEDHARKASCFSVMATQNGTVVTVNFAQSNLLLSGNNPPSSNVPLVFNLNAGESYTAAIVMDEDINNLGKGFIGTLITSNLPIAVNTGSWAGSLRDYQGADIGFDQIVDLSLVGDKYTMVRGQGAGTNDDDMEQVMVVAHYDSTIIFANGNPIAVDTIEAGEYRLLDGTFYNNEVMYIETSRPTYLYQIILGGENTSNTQGMNFVPPISCYTSSGVNNIPTIETIGTRTHAGGISIVTRAGSTVLVNGAPPTTAPIPVPGSNYEAYKILSLTGNVDVTTNSIALVGFFGYENNAGYGGYYSGFDRVESTSSIIEDCLPGVLRTTSALNSTYQWHKDGMYLSKETADTLKLLTQGDYFVIFELDECKDTSATISILPTPTGDVGNDFYVCPGADTIVSLNSKSGITASWFGINPNSDLTINSAGTYWAEFKNANDCAINDTLVVTSDNLIFTSAAIDNCTPGLLTSYSNLVGTFQWYKDGMLLSDETNDTLSFSTEGNYFVTFTQNQCTDTSSAYGMLPVLAVDLGNDFKICNGGDPTTVSIDNYATILWHDGSGGTSYSASVSEQIHVQVTDGNGCQKTDSVVATVAPAATPFSLREDTTICEKAGDEVMLLVDNQGRDVLWNDGSESVAYSAIFAGEYKVTLTDTNGCAVSDSIVLSDFCTTITFTMPNIFTPNNNGINDYMIPIEMEWADKDFMFANIQYIRFSVYNRWGVMVHANEGVLPRWDGRAPNGSPCSDATYYWTLQYQDAADTEYHLNGFVKLYNPKAN